MENCKKITSFYLLWLACKYSRFGKVSVFYLSISPTFKNHVIYTQGRWSDKEFTLCNLWTYADGKEAYIFFYRRQSTKQEDFHSAEVLDFIAINAVQSWRILVKCNMSYDQNKTCIWSIKKNNNNHNLSVKWLYSQNTDTPRNN